MRVILLEGSEDLSLFAAFRQHLNKTLQRALVGVLTKKSLDNEIMDHLHRLLARRSV